MEIKVLTVIDHGENEGDTARVTFQAMNISMVRSPDRLVKRQGLTLHRVLVKLIDEALIELYLNGEDLKMLEEATGFFGIADD